MNILVIDIGGTNVKMLATGQSEPLKFPSGPTLAPEQMVAQAKELTAEWKYDALTIGYPGVVLGGQIALEPRNLDRGWVGFDFESAFGCPVKLINDAAMQALGSYEQGVLLFLGLGTGLGAAMIVQGVVVPLELGRLQYRKGTYESYLGLRGLKRLGKKKWRKHVERAVADWIAAFHPNDVVIGGGNIRKLKALPPGCRAGDNANAFLGGFRLWEEARHEV